MRNLHVAVPIDTAVTKEARVRDTGEEQSTGSALGSPGFLPNLLHFIKSEDVTHPNL